MYQWLDAKSQLSAMEPASPTRVVREAECVNFTAQAGHCTPRPALVADRRDFSCAEALCPSCSWRIAELACDPVWIDDARSRIRGAALAVVEAQQASAELSARVAEASSAEILSGGECQDAFGRSSGSFSTKDNQASKGRNSATFGRWWSRETCNDDVTEDLDGAYLTDSCRSNSIDAPFADLSRNSSRRSFQRAATTGSANLQNVEVTISPRSIRRTKTSSLPTEVGDAPLREKRGGLVDMVRHAFMRSPSTS
ncbi:hypothetical protein CLOP_g5939 [Closterium sp. NIES-67]|nr:hypothetical protein CLOP_g5939 [Closterium sp. NIES-67]